MANELKPLNCLDSFLALFRGTTSDAQINDLIEYMVKSSYFFSVESVNKRYETMCAVLKLNVARENKEELKQELTKKDYVLKAEKDGFFYCRYSTVKGENSSYYNINRSLIDSSDISSKTAILNYQKENQVYFKSVDSKGTPFYLDVKIDNDGNAWARSLINQVCGYWVSKGKDSTIKNATISHIWGNASNPLYFTSLWNIVIVPTFCNFILDKNEIKSENNDEEEDERFVDIINRVNNTFKAICWKMYDVQNKQFGGRITIKQPAKETLKLAESYINLIPKEHILG